MGQVESRQKGKRSRTASTSGYATEEEVELVQDVQMSERESPTPLKRRHFDRRNKRLASRDGGFPHPSDSGINVTPRDVPDFSSFSCFPILFEPLSRFADQEGSSSDVDDRQPACGRLLRVDCKKVNSFVGSAVSTICGIQPVMLRKRQHVFVMRHGDTQAVARARQIAERPWDPLLTERGKQQAMQTGLRLRREGWGCTRIVCSPYRSCVETAAELAEALTTMDGNVIEGCSETVPPGKSPAHRLRTKVTRRIVNAVASPFRSSGRQDSKRRKTEDVQPPFGVKVSVDYGLAPIMSCGDNPHQEGYLLTRDQLESLLPRQLVDRPPAAQLALPGWPEEQSAGIVRLVAAIDRISEEFLDDDIILLTHAEAVHSSIVRCQKGKGGCQVETTGFSHLQRNVYKDVEDEEERGIGRWELVAKHGHTGVQF